MREGAGARAVVARAPKVVSGQRWYEPVISGKLVGNGVTHGPPLLCHHCPQVMCGRLEPTTLWMNLLSVGDLVCMDSYGALGWGVEYIVWSIG